jgi:hypothetical protein
MVIDRMLQFAPSDIIYDSISKISLQGQSGSVATCETNAQP